MRLFALCALFCCGLVFAQEGFDKPRRQKRQRLRFPDRGRPRVPRVPTLAMEIDGNFAYVLIGTTLYKVNLETMETVASCNLREGEEGGEIVTAADMIKRLDKDGDGKISKEEWIGPAPFFDRLDRNGDGAITEDEIPQKLIDIMRQRLAPKTPPLPAVIRFSKDSVIILLGNTLYKVRKSDLLLVGQTKLKTKKRHKKEKPAPEKEKPNEKKPAPPKKEKDDFGF